MYLHIYLLDQNLNIVQCGYMKACLGQKLVRNIHRDSRDFFTGDYATVALFGAIRNKEAGEHLQEHISETFIIKILTGLNRSPRGPNSDWGPIGQCAAHTHSKKESWTQTVYNPNRPDRK